jgi:uncharacterized membrane protein
VRQIKIDFLGNLQIMGNPFDLRAVLLSQHAQHVVLIHFPIALFIAGVGFDLVSRGKLGSRFATAAYLNLAAAAVTVIPTLLTGLLAWEFVLNGEIIGLLLWHLVAASFAAVLVIASWWVHWRARKSGPLLLPS